MLACRAIRAQQIQPGARRQNSPFCTGQPATLDGTAAAQLSQQSLRLILGGE